jgi:hypothetical protein
LAIIALDGYAASREALSVATASVSFEERSGAAFWAAEPHQSCEPQSVPICPEQDVSVLGSFLEAALLNFQPCLTEFVG